MKKSRRQTRRKQIKRKQHGGNGNPHIYLVVFNKSSTEWNILKEDIKDIFNKYELTIQDASDIKLFNGTVVYNKNQFRTFFSTYATEWGYENLDPGSKGSFHVFEIPYDDLFYYLKDKSQHFDARLTELEYFFRDILKGKLTLIGEPHGLTDSGVSMFLAGMVPDKGYNPRLSKFFSYPQNSPKQSVETQPSTTQPSTTPTRKSVLNNCIIQ